MDRTSKSPPLILASASPRRRKLLAEAGLVFEVVSPPVDEPDHVGLLPPAQRAEALAYFKARSVSQYYPASLILGADTIVAVGGVVLGKPADQLEARRMLQRLSGTRHVVITGVALLGPDKRRLIASETTYVTMRPMSNGEIESYIASGEWDGKAGAYAIQETADRFVVSVEGSFSNVVGLPVKLVKRMVNELWKSPDAHKPR